MTSSPRVSVIMRAKNSDWVIAQALGALYSQSFVDFELIVVDSGSTDKTLDIVRQYPCKLIQIEATQYYPGAVLNMAIEQSRGELIVFQNSDSVPLSQQSLQRLVDAFDDPTVDAALARQLPRPEAETWVKKDYEISFPDAEQTPNWIRLSLPMAAMRKTAWEKHPFYTDAWASEDTEWGQWAVQNGLNIKYIKDAIVMHSHNYTLKQIYGRKFVEGEADAFIYGTKPSLLRAEVSLVKGCLRDAFTYLKARDFKNMPKIIGRNVVYHWAHYKGLQLGHRRISTGDKDTSKGQVNVLSRYDD